MSNEAGPDERAILPFFCLIMIFVSRRFGVRASAQGQQEHDLDSFSVAYVWDSLGKNIA